MKKTETGFKTHKVKHNSTKEEFASTYEQTVYDLNGITYVPHYRNHNIYVGPGYPRSSKQRYSGAELELYGAKPRVAMLWSRGSIGEVSDKNP